MINNILWNILEDEEPRLREKIASDRNLWISSTEVEQAMQQI